MYGRDRVIVDLVEQVRIMVPSDDGMEIDSYPLIKVQLLGGYLYIRYSHIHFNSGATNALEIEYGWRVQE